MKKKIFLVSGASSDIFQKLIKKNYFDNSQIVGIYNSSKNLIRETRHKYLMRETNKLFLKLSQDQESLLIMTWISLLTTT